MAWACTFCVGLLLSSGASSEAASSVLINGKPLGQVDDIVKGGGKGFGMFVSGVREEDIFHDYQVGSSCGVQLTIGDESSKESFWLIRLP